MHPFALFPAACLVLLAFWFAAEALGARDRVLVRRALSAEPCSRLRAAQTRAAAFVFLCLAALIAAGVVLASGTAG